MAGAAIGVSHLVQSTRAGAEYGFQLVGLILVANLLKFPFLEVGPRYALASGRNLLHGYARLGSWALWVYALFTLGTMFIIMAALSLFTASLALSILPIDLDSRVLAVFIQLLCVLLLLVGKYHLLQRAIRWIMAILFISSLMAFVLVLWNGPVANPFEVPQTNWLEPVHFAFLLALMGWMPIPLDAAVWHSIWALEHRAEMGKGSHPISGALEPFTLKESLRDFNIGYLFASVLALLFVTLGAYVMYGSGTSFPESGAGFANQLITLYTSALGSAAFPVIATAAFFTMFSTTLTVMDSFPRVWQAFYALFLKQKANRTHKLHRAYQISMIALVIGSTILLFWFLASFKSLVDLATTLSFLTAPILAFIHYRLVQYELPIKYQWNGWRLWLARMGMLFLTVFAVVYLLQIV
jgi:Mn2+/Fe2+ NRAMP family transporter